MLFKYNKENYDEDLKITHFVLNNYFAKVHFDDYEQIINDCLYRLYCCRPYFDCKRSVYSTYSVLILNGFLNNKLRFERRHLNNLRKRTIFLDDDLGDGATLSDYIGTEDNFNDIGLYGSIERVLKHYKEKECQIIRLYIRGYKMPEIAKAFICTRQNISLVINKFRKDLRAELKKVGYEI